MQDKSGAAHHDRAGAPSHGRQHPGAHHHPPADTPSYPIAMISLIGLLLLLCAVAWWYWDRHLAVQPMSVEVILDNRCELFDDAFMVVSSPDQQKAYFDKGRAHLKTQSNAKIVVRSSDRYPDFELETSSYRVAPQVVMTVRCGDRIERTMDALRQQFKGEAER